MSNKAATPENPNAFPSDEIREREVYQQFQGMTLRDYFAAKALESIMNKYHNISDHDQNKLQYAQESYRIADAMLKARQQ